MTDNWTCALVRAWERLEGPGDEVYVVEVTAQGDGPATNSYHAVPRDEWADFAQRMADNTQGLADVDAVLVEREVRCEVLAVLRAPVESPPEFVRHMFVAGRRPSTLHAHPPGVQ